MRSISFKFICLTFFLLAGCTEEKIVNTSEMGHIKGRVMSKSDTIYAPLEHAGVEIPGTSVRASTDSLGNFILFNIPEGSYDLEVNYYWTEKVNDVIVKSDQTTNINDIIFEMSEDPDQTSFLRALYILYSNGNGRYLSHNDTSIIDLDDIGSDSLLLAGCLVNYNRRFPVYQDTQFTVLYNSTIYFTETSKGFFYQKLPILEGFCELKVWPGHSSQINENCYNTTFIISKIEDTYILLDWYSHDNPAGDFDLHLINKELNDSCWYKNPNPDWGVQDYRMDNPVLYEDSNPYGDNSGYETLYMNETPDGAYQINVVYFSNVFNDTVLVAPDVYLSLNDSTYEFNAPDSMSVGQVWTVAEFIIPDMSITPINTIKKYAQHLNQKKIMENVRKE
jgi:hypothetical protein